MAKPHGILGSLPPDVLEFIVDTPAGKALDLGCGTGTNAITLAVHGWQVTGVDFASKAIKIARQRTKAAGLQVSYHVADVTDLSMPTGPYDYALDIGCLFVLEETERIKYTEGLARLMRPGGWYMLYAWLPRVWKGAVRSISAQDVEVLLRPHFSMVHRVIGEEKGYPSAWYWFQRR